MPVAKGDNQISRTWAIQVQVNSHLFSFLPIKEQEALVIEKFKPSFTFGIYFEWLRPVHV